MNAPSIRIGSAPFDDTDALRRIAAFVADAAGCEVAAVGPDSNIHDDLGVDSLGTTAIFIDVTAEFGVPEPSSEESYLALNTPRRILEYIRSCQAASGGVSVEAPSLAPAADSVSWTPIADIAAIVRQGDAFRFVDTASVHGSARIKTVKRWSLEDPRIAAHFPGGPYVVPGVLIAEQVAQSAAALAVYRKLVPNDGLLAIGQLRFELRAPAMAPCEVEADVSVRKTVLGHFEFSGHCSAHDVVLGRVRGIATWRTHEISGGTA